MLRSLPVFGRIAATSKRRTGSCPKSDAASSINRAGTAGGAGEEFMTPTGRRPSIDGSEAESRADPGAYGRTRRVERGLPHGKFAIDRRKRTRDEVARVGEPERAELTRGVV